MTDPFTPVTLITGFLGSGKTTLLQRLLADPALADTAVLINEFGEIGLDHHLLERIDERTVLLTSGCLCCTVRGELSDALRDLHSRRAREQVPWFHRVIIESTGLADPVLKHHFRMERIVTTVDAVNGARTLANHAESVKQVAVADRIVLTKTDIADAAAAASVVRRVRAINPSAPLLRPDDTSLVDSLLGDDSDASTRADGVGEAWISEQMAAADAGGNPHVQDVTAFAITFDHLVDWTAFSLWLTMLLHRHGAAVLRVKGILNVAGTDTPVAIHGVQHLVHPPLHMRAWPSADRRSRLVFIMKNLDARAIERSFAVFCASSASRAPA